MRKSAWMFALVVLIALGFGIRKARAQSYEYKPFTAVSTTSVRGEAVIPTVDNEVIAVSDGGKIVARLQRSKFDASVRWHWIQNATDKTSTVIDHGSKMRVAYPYKEAFELAISRNKTSDHCDGEPAGQIEGLDVTMKETSGTSNGDPSKRKVWLAPKLGCFVIREERTVTDAAGKVKKFTVHSLSQIELGEPDPSYFDTSLPEGYTDTKLEDYRGALVNHKANQ